MHSRNGARAALLYDADNNLTGQRKLVGGRDHRAIVAEMGFPAARCDAQLSPHRHCERSEAIQNLSAEGLWIASAFAEASADKSLRSQ
jgi:hypothetical protein